MSENKPNYEERVLVFAPTGRDGELTCAFLERAGLGAQLCCDVADVVHKVGEGCGAIVLAEEGLGMSSVQKLNTLLSDQPSWSDIPIIIISTTGDGNDHTARRLAVFSAMGNVAVLERPFRPNTLVSALQVALRSRRRQYQMRDLVKTLGESEQRYRMLAETLETQVKARTAALEEINHELEAFTYTIAHDLRAPLRQQESFSTALLDEFGQVLGETGSDYARRINNSATRLNLLVQDLLTFSRMSRAQIPVERLNLRKAVEDVCAEMDFQINETHAVVRVNQFSFTVRGHEATFKTVLTNLISNAMKFSKPDIAPQIVIGAEENGNWVRLTVQDNGIGIDPDHHKQIFGVFHRLHEVGRYPGTGVGLAIVQKGVERMGGSVGVESHEGEGSRFWVELQKWT